MAFIAPGLTFAPVPPTFYPAPKFTTVPVSTVADYNESSSSLSSSGDYANHPFMRVNGRAYMRDPDNPYPLPCDLPELHRQTLRTLSLFRVFGAPFCAPQVEKKPPKRVLELACGSGLWSNALHEYFVRENVDEIEFTGVDILPMAPDLRNKGVNWQFKRHDIRQSKLPFPSDHFDYVFIKDAGLCETANGMQDDLLSEPLRVLKSGGILEVWDSDPIIRTLVPNVKSPSNLTAKSKEQARATGTYTFSAGVPFAKAQNKYIQEYNNWVRSAFQALRLTPRPCVTIEKAFAAVSKKLKHVDSRRIAIPLSGEVRWERDAVRAGTRKPLTPNQLSLRRAILITVIQMMDGMEPLLMGTSEMGRDEWDVWWAAMTDDILNKNGLSNGECLEVGAWWGQKK